VLGIAFIVIEGFDWYDKPFEFATNVYSTLYFTITGFHLAHVFIGLIVLSVLLVWTALGYFGETRHAAVSIGTIYWHFVTVVWLFVFSTFFIAPRLG
jgi:heme/copper-type cytochrome/quinol oxidase subunit 3